LATALGAAIEVEAQVMSRRHEDSAAIEMLERELKAYGDTTLGNRIQKNLNMLVLVGRPLRALDLKQYVGRTPPPLASQRAVRGPVLLGALVPGVQGDGSRVGENQSEFARRAWSFNSRRVVRLHQRGEDATPAEEMRYIEKVRNETYRGSKTPSFLWGSTISGCMVRARCRPWCLVDRQGVVRALSAWQDDLRGVGAAHRRVAALT
jgi:hypothetical protein